MSYRHDPIHHAVHWLRTRPEGRGSFAEVWARRVGIPPDGLRIRVGLTNYKPFERARVMAELVRGRNRQRRAASVVRRLSLHVAATPADARREVERGVRELGASAAMPILLEDQAVVAWSLPHAPALGILAELDELVPFQAWAADRPALAGAAMPELVRYVPLKRALLVGAGPHRGRRLWWKLFAGREAGDVALNLREVRAWHEAGAMAGQLGAQRQELLAQQALLERKVGERTGELAEANRQLAAANRRLRDLDRLRVLFLADVSHELRTPLTVLRGEAEVTLRSRTDDITDCRETLVSVVEQAAQMGRLVDDLLFLTRAEADSIRFQLGELVLQEVFDEALGEGRVLARERGNELVPRFAQEPLRVVADRQRLKQTALIAIDNAIKYAHPRTPVEIELAAAGGQVVARVRNRGLAIPAEDLPYVFDRFYRGRQDKTGLNGSGLGLSIAKWIVDKHGGAISLQSSPNGVTELEFKLPRAGRAQPGAIV